MIFSAKNYASPACLAKLCQKIVGLQFSETRYISFIQSLKSNNQKSFEFADGQFFREN